MKKNFLHMVSFLKDSVTESANSKTKFCTNDKRMHVCFIVHYGNRQFYFMNRDEYGEGGGFYAL